MSVRAHDIAVHRGGRPVLHGCDLDARAGELTAIVGPNGSGKSTLLGALSGELTHGGRIEINGRDIARRPAWEIAAERAVLPQSQGVAFPFTATEVVRMGLSAGVNGARPEIATRAIERVGLAHKAGEIVHTLSGGEQQRVHLARVLAQVWQPVAGGTPRWLFLDEPVASLDIGHQLQVMEIAAGFAAAGGGVIAVMHDLNLTAMFADHVLLLDAGRVAAAGPVPDVLTDAHLGRAYGCPVRVNATPPAGARFVLPHASRAQPSTRRIS